MRLSRSDQAREAQRELAAMRRAPQRDCAYLPGWAYRLAIRVHDGYAGQELMRVPPAVARAIRNAAAPYTRLEARRSVIALGLVLWWLSVRHPRRCGQPTTLAGLGLGLLAGLTQSATGQPYSVSALAHGWHGRGELDPDARGRGGGVRGLGKQVGFLVALERARVLRVWIPPVDRCPAWMIGPRGYAYLCFRAVMDPSAIEPEALLAAVDPLPS